ncbi:MAG TPA: flagellar biosynthetic protein FliR [Alphaproteobacteria bacterium]|nr:flagellar biosynthetic protein FliR [Alphaproteobacteria bacterium]
MESIEEFLVSGVFAFLLIFVRLGTAMMIMPAFGDSFIPTNIRLLIALAMSFVLMPIMQNYIPSPIPALPVVFSLILMEFVIGLFFGTIARVLIAALDTAGMVISMTSGLANAQVFNPSMASQGSITGAFLSMTGVVLLFVTNMHHMLIYGLVESYQMFPVGGVPDTGSMAELMIKAFSASFLIGFQIAVPFVVVAILLYIGMGVLSRVMPQVQVFILALPVQIMLSMLTLMLVLSSGMLFWLTRFEDGMTFFLTSGG